MSQSEFDSFTYFSSGFLLISLMFALAYVCSRGRGDGGRVSLVPGFYLVTGPMSFSRGRISDGGRVSKGVGYLRG